MRVLFITMQFGEGYFQGTERYLQRLAAGLENRGHRALILAGDPEHREPPETGFVRIPTAGWTAVLGPDPHAAAREIDRFAPDVVHALNPAHVGTAPLAVARDRGIPTVVTTMDYWWVCPTHTLLRPGNEICPGSRPWRECARCIARRHANPAVRTAAALPVLGPALAAAGVSRAAAARGATDEDRRAWRARGEHLGAALRAADTVIFPAEATESIIGSAYPGLRGVRIPYGVEDDWFGVERPPAPGPFSPATARIGYAGAFAPHKGVHHLLEALARLGWNDTSVRLAGAGDEATTARLRALGTGLNAEFVGRLDAAAMRTFLADLDVLVVPSVWPENLPIVTLEAAAAGTPVIASRVAGLTEHVPEACLFEPGSSADLARVLDRWIGSGERPPAPPRPITTGEMVERTIAVYERITAGRSAAGPAR